MIKGIQINKSKVVHLYRAGTDRTDCGAGGMGDISGNGGVLTDDAVTCKRCLKSIAAAIEQAHAEAIAEQTAREQAEEGLAAVREVSAMVEQLAAEVEQAHAEAIEENAQRYGCHLAKWFDAKGVRHYCDVRVPMEGVPWRDQHHAGPCYDALTETWREDPAPSRKQRKAGRRAQRATLRRMTPQLRAAGRARRAQRGTARATAKTLLVAAGVPQDIAKSYAPAFSKGSGAEKVKTRVRKGDTARTKRAEVMRYTWTQFTARLEQYRPADAFGPAAAEFRAARERVLV